MMSDIIIITLLFSIIELIHEFINQIKNLKKICEHNFKDINLSLYRYRWPLK